VNGPIAGKRFPRSARRCSGVMLSSVASVAIVSTIHDGPLTVDVPFELNNDELLITDYALDEIAD
jgi:hypothetical protein